nr:hypothetical protein CFP56_60513 [Quercus suber]
MRSSRGAIHQSSNRSGGGAESFKAHINTCRSSVKSWIAMSLAKLKPHLHRIRFCLYGPKRSHNLLTTVQPMRGTRFPK